jgi:hypothetical protein
VSTYTVMLNDLDPPFPIDDNQAYTHDECLVIYERMLRERGVPQQWSEESGEYGYVYLTDCLELPPVALISIGERGGLHIKYIGEEVSEDE